MGMRKICSTRVLASSRQKGDKCPEGKRNSFSVSLPYRKGVAVVSSPPSWFWCLRILATRWLEVLSVSFRILLLMIYRACLCKKQTGRRKNSSPPFYSFVHLRPLYLGTGNHNGQITLARNRESNCLHKMECRPRAVSCRLVKSKRSRNLIIWKPLFSRICIRKGLGGESWNGFLSRDTGMSQSLHSLYPRECLPFR